MSNENNLKLWDSVSKTDPRYTKAAKKGQFQFTSIAPMYQFKKATEAFGVQGIGWGVVPESEVFTEQEINGTYLINYDAVLFFRYSGERGEIPIHATEKLAYTTNGGKGYLKIDDEVRKKVVTNAKTKGLSELGISADVFMGEFDDPNYVEMRAYEESVAKAEESQDKYDAAVVELKEWCKKEADTYSAAKSVAVLNQIHMTIIRKAEGKCNALQLNFESYKSALAAKFNERKTEIESMEKK